LESGTPDIKISKDIEALSENFCTELISEINSLLLKNSKVNIALSGGGTPKATFRKLVSFKEKINWEKVNFFWGDERCVPPDDQQSNYGMAEKYLFARITIPPENVFRIKGENDPLDEAKRYSDVIRNNLSIHNNLPAFEIMLLGLGEDGHTASIFPDQMELLESDDVCEVAFHPATKQKRITITGRIINNSKRIYFLVAGKNKAAAVGGILNKEANYIQLPGYYIKPVNGKVTWFLDKEAASKLISKHD
jgi:6-phosphogluconolactonase